MDISKLKIDPSSLGNNLMLTDVNPVYKYENHARTDEVIGYRYTVACPKLDLEKVGIKVEGAQKVDKPASGFPIVDFVDMEIKLYVINGDAQISATAKDVKVIKNV